ncbi:flagellar biosynthetic protein FliO [Alkaliphilus sp. MSJ-5]|uniref:Flagellar biosynthetic protein FliO n=1 Tax=Alkaliphilus flagellatus TaxID=2841507 RepID=A0ABS6G729_9FIRM|nr:flagellar biosynthetic protein FliO [Alkaliphilus flagellatus]MBU5677428.1 flagellar biosynthetic protein FliO [Alkaliphilus flagellatus]
MNNTLSGLFLLIATVITIVFAYYITIIIGKKTNKLMKGRYTQVLERTMIGLNISITLVKINKKIYIIALQGKTIKLLDAIDESEWSFLTTGNENSFEINNRINNLFKNRLFKK